MFDVKKGYFFKDLPFIIKGMLDLIQAKSILDKHHLLSEDNWRSCINIVVYNLKTFNFVKFYWKVTISYNQA